MHDVSTAAARRARAPRRPRRAPGSRSSATSRAGRTPAGTPRRARRAANHARTSRSSCTSFAGWSSMKPASCTGVGGVITAVPKPATSGMLMRLRPPALDRRATRSNRPGRRISRLASRDLGAPRVERGRVVRGLHDRDRGAPVDRGDRRRALPGDRGEQLVERRARRPRAARRARARRPDPSRVSGVRLSRWSVASVPITVSWWSGPDGDDQLAWIVPIAPLSRPREQLRVGLDVAPPAVARRRHRHDVLAGDRAHEVDRRARRGPSGIRRRRRAASKNHSARAAQSCGPAVAERGAEAGDLTDPSGGDALAARRRTARRTGCSGTGRGRRRCSSAASIIASASAVVHAIGLSTSTCRPGGDRAERDLAVVRVRRRDQHGVDVGDASRRPATDRRPRRSPTRRAATRPTRVTGSRTR